MFSCACNSSVSDAPAPAACVAMLCSSVCCHAVQQRGSVAHAVKLSQLCAWWAGGAQQNRHV